mgnify:CR=1 FL=1
MATIIQGITNTFVAKSLAGDIDFDTSKPDGTQRKLLDVSRLSSLGWEYSMELEQGLNITYEWFLDHLDELRG